jgi:hypothetical protein
LFLKGVVSVDDLTFTTSNCSVRPLNEAVPTTLSPAMTTSTATTRRSTAASQSPLDCNFEDGVLCRTWTDDNSADFRWEVKRGRTPSVNTGPSVG